MFNGGMYGGYPPAQNMMPQFPSRFSGMDAMNAPRYEIIHVNGENGARALQMAANSNVLLLDDNAPIIWFVQTDGAGYKTITPYNITPMQAEAPVDVKGLEARIKILEEMLNGKPDNANAEPSAASVG